MVHFDECGSFSTDALVHFGSGIQNWTKLRIAYSYIEFHLYSSGCIVKLCKQAHRKRKYIMRFEIRYFFSWDWVKPEGLNLISRRKYLIQNLIIYFRFPRACVRNYTMRVLLYGGFYVIKSASVFPEPY